MEIYVLAVTFFAAANLSSAAVPVAHDRVTIGAYADCERVRAVSEKKWRKDRKMFASTCRAWRPGDPPLAKPRRAGVLG